MTRRGTLLFGWVLALLVMAGFARLGFWQLARMHEKQAMLDRAALVLHDRVPQSFAAVDARAAAGRPADSALDLAWVEDDGRVLPVTLLLDNQIHDSQPGVRVYCVLQPARGIARLVDLGWLPVGGDRKLPDATCPAGALHVRGLSAAPPSSGLAIGGALQSVGPQRWLLTRVDLRTIATTLRMEFAPHVVRLDPALPIGYARDLDILPNTLPPARHLGYAVQWWALSLAVFATALLLTFRKSQRRA